MFSCFINANVGIIFENSKFYFHGAMPRLARTGETAAALNLYCHNIAKFSRIPNPEAKKNIGISPNVFQIGGTLSFPFLVPIVVGGIGHRGFSVYGLYLVVDYARHIAFTIVFDFVVYRTVNGTP